MVCMEKDWCNWTQVCHQKRFLIFWWWQIFPESYDWFCSLFLLKPRVKISIIQLDLAEGYLLVWWDGAWLCLSNPRYWTFHFRCTEKLLLSVVFDKPVSSNGEWGRKSSGSWQKEKYQCHLRVKDCRTSKKTRRSAEPCSDLYPLCG